MSKELARRAEAFRALHEGPKPLVLPNAWDPASARAVARAGFPAIATTSGGVAESLGFTDHEGAPADAMFQAAREIGSAVDLPVTVDAEAGYGLSPEALVERLLGVGAVGCNLEDTDHARGGLRDAEAQARFLQEVRQAAERAGVPLFVNARVDVYLHGDAAPEERTDEAIRRGRRYLAAGADGVYPILARGRSVLGRLAEAFDAPVNAMATPGGLGLGELAELGIRRVSYGGGLYRAGAAELPEALERIREEAAAAPS